jgi:hypothetical protein
VQMNTKKVWALKLFGRQYCEIDIDGGATAFFSTTIDQTGLTIMTRPTMMTRHMVKMNLVGQHIYIGTQNLFDITAHGENDICGGSYKDQITGFIRYQGDQKLHGGSRRHDLRTLVLSKVKGCESVSTT